MRTSPIPLWFVVIKLTVLAAIGTIATINYIQFRKDIREFRARNPVIETNKP